MTTVEAGRNGQRVGRSPRNAPPVPSEEGTLRIKNLTVSYGGPAVLEDITFDAEPGCSTGIMGPNGSGKTTLMKATLGLISRHRGCITFDGKPVPEVRRRIAYVPQAKDVDWTFPINVIDTVLQGTYPRLGLFRRPAKPEREEARQCLGRVGLESFAKRQIGELSGGQQQRVFLARALAQRADLLLLDEPFTGIDAASEAKIAAVLRELRAEGKTILVVHHNLAQAHAYFDQLVFLNKRLIAAGPVDKVLKPEILSEVYGLGHGLSEIND